MSQKTSTFHDSRLKCVMYIWSKWIRVSEKKAQFQRNIQKGDTLLNCSFAIVQKVALNKVLMSNIKSEIWVSLSKIFRIRWD